jgi:hypothetical protein
MTNRPLHGAAQHDPVPDHQEAATMTSTRVTGHEPPAAGRAPSTVRERPAGARHLRALLLGLVAALAVLSGCSRLDIAYGTAPFLIQRWANDYLDLDSAQATGWEPRLKAALAAHRATELPVLTGFVEGLYEASLSGFDAANTRCLTAAFQDLYRRHARLAVDTAAPLLAALTPAQVGKMEKEFAVQTAKDRAEPSYPEFERARRARRYTKSIEEWTGPLNAPQRALIAEITGRMPLTVKAALDYRTRQYKALIALLRTRPGEAAVAHFLTDWLVDFRDLPPTLAAAVPQVRSGVEELLMRLGTTLDQAQRRRLTERLAGLRDDLMRLQKDPRVVTPVCPA